MQVEYAEKLVAEVRSVNSMNPTLTALNPTLKGLNPTPHGLHPAPEGLDPTPKGLHPTFEIPKMIEPPKNSVETPGTGVQVRYAEKLVAELRSVNSLKPTPPALSHKP